MVAAMGFKENKVDFSTKAKFTDELASFVSHEAGFITGESNEAASANMDALVEKAVIASRSKNQSEMKMEKVNQRFIKQDIIEAKKDVKRSEKEQIIRVNQRNIEQNELNKMIQENQINPSNHSYSKEQLAEKREVIKNHNRFIEKEDTRIEAKQTELQKHKASKKEHKKSETKARKKAATKTSVAGMLRVKKDIANGLVSDKATGDAMADGKTGLVGTVLEVINPMHYFKSWLAKIGATIAPYVLIFMTSLCVIVMVIALMFDVLAPITEVGEAITSFLSIFTNERVFTNETLTAEKIDEIVAGSGCDETQETVIRFALSKVGYPYSQANRTSGSYYDCSSLVYYSWNEANVDVSFGTNYPPTAAEGARLLNTAGKTVASVDAASFSMKPGDLIYYGGSNNGRYKGIYHVAVYIGNGCVVEALNEQYGVVYENVRTKNIIMVCRPNN